MVPLFQILVVLEADAEAASVDDGLPVELELPELEPDAPAGAVTQYR